MPFIADSRCGVWNIELNVGEICGELERMLEKEYSEDIKEGSKFWLYVSQIEYALNRCDTMPDFWEWFLTDEEYNNVEMWNEIQDLFLDEDECDDCRVEEENGECFKCEKTFKKDLNGWGATNLWMFGGINFCHNCWDGETSCEVENSVEGEDGDMYWTPGDWTHQVALELEL